MRENRPFINILSSGVQAIAVQVLGSAFFYLISIELPKTDFGLISWMNAVCLLLTTLLGFGIEQVVVRRIAASSRSDWAAAAFLAHAVAGFLITFLLLMLLRNTTGVYHYLPWFFAAQGLIYVGVPLKQFLNAKERFAPYGIIATISNSGKLLAVLILSKQDALGLHSVIVVLVIAAVFELLSLFIYVLTKTTFSFKVKFKAYSKLLKEASAQYLSVIFDMSLSRMDWILLGLLTSNAVLADYSFAYRAFELARLPMLIIGPIILPKLARLMSGGKPGIADQQKINSFCTVEMFLGVLIPLILNILWLPVVTLITKGKYGDANALQFLLLSMCIPIQLFINLLWSVSFSLKQYRQVTTITIVCAVLNVLLNLILIPKLNGLGAAIAFLATTILQGVLYFHLARKTLSVSLKPLALFILSAAVIYFFVVRVNVHYILQLLIAVGTYVLIAIASRQVNKQHLANFKAFLTR